MGGRGEEQGERKRRVRERRRRKGGRKINEKINKNGRRVERKRKAASPLLNPSTQLPTTSILW